MWEITREYLQVVSGFLKHTQQLRSTIIIFANKYIKFNSREMPSMDSPHSFSRLIIPCTSEKKIPEIELITKTEDIKGLVDKCMRYTKKGVPIYISYDNTLLTFVIKSDELVYRADICTGPNTLFPLVDPLLNESPFMEEIKSEASMIFKFNAISSSLQLKQAMMVNTTPVMMEYDTKWLRINSSVKIEIFGELRKGAKMAIQVFPYQVNLIIPPKILSAGLIYWHILVPGKGLFIVFESQNEDLENKIIYSSFFVESSFIIP